MSQFEFDCCVDNALVNATEIVVETRAGASTEPSQCVNGGTKAVPSTLCYCFGFTEKDIRDEIAETGTTTIPNKIVSLIRDGLCSCAALNPSGLCCLGDVNRVVKKMMADKRGD
ncbi:MAG: hypothetical protein ACR2HX_21090 [Pyrinomonadaceae bacterium]